MILLQRKMSSFVCILLGVFVWWGIFSTQELLGATIDFLNPLSSVNSVPGLVNRILQGLFGIIGTVALVIFMYGGFTWMTAQGAEKKIKQGFDTMAWSALGLVVIFGSYTVLNFFLGILVKGTPEPTTASISNSSGMACSGAKTIVDSWKSWDSCTPIPQSIVAKYGTCSLACADQGYPINCTNSTTCCCTGPKITPPTRNGTCCILVEKLSGAYRVSGRESSSGDCSAGFFQSNPSEALHAGIASEDKIQEVKWCNVSEECPEQEDGKFSTSCLKADWST